MPRRSFKSFSGIKSANYSVEKTKLDFIYEHRLEPPIGP
jgi:hypothetical protein